MKGLRQAHSLEFDNPYLQIKSGITVSLMESATTN
jgi:hypothetical protein